MTTTKRYPTRPVIRRQDDFYAVSEDGRTYDPPTYRCVNCGTEIGAVEDGFDEFWIDLATPDDDAWCGPCVDDPEEDI
jgi:hypothetical protein